MMLRTRIEIEQDDARVDVAVSRCAEDGLDEAPWYEVVFQERIGSEVVLRAPGNLLREVAVAILNNIPGELYHTSKEDGLVCDLENEPLSVQWPQEKPDA